MKGSSEEQLAVGRIYADALLTVAEEQGVADELLDEVGALAELCAREPEALAVLANPLVDADARRANLRRILRGRLHDLLVDTLQVMNRKGRLGYLPAFAEAYREALDELRGRTEVEVVTAVPLSEEARIQVVERVSEVTGLTPHLVERVEPGLLGGMVVKIGDRKIDGSVARELARVGEILLERGSREIQSLAE